MVSDLQWVKIIAVDFDGTLCEERYPKIGAAKEEVIQYVLNEQAKGSKIILWTCRRGERLNEAVRWCKEHGITFDAINENLPGVVKSFGGDTRKIVANEYLDDRAVNALNIKRGKKQYIAYKCDKKKCDHCSSNEWSCRHTTDISHAVNFKRISLEEDDEFYMEMEVSHGESREKKRRKGRRKAKNRHL